MLIFCCPRPKVTVLHIHWCPCHILKLCTGFGIFALFPGNILQLQTANPGDYTLHIFALKTTTLSWSNQLAQQGLVTEGQRHLQGHHRKGSMRLYSRDDTAGQLALQNTLIVQVQQGHRFVTPLHRGSQRPIHEPSVSLERFRKAYQE